MMTHKELKSFSDLCKDVLTYPETGYAKDKKFITPFFAEKLEKGNVENVRRRLILIDALYSTNMSRRLYGIDELANDLSFYSDEDAVAKFKSALKDHQEEWVYQLFERKYGKKKSDAKPAARCFSLISKYVYYLCDFDFPIYDSLVRYYFNDLLKEIVDKPERGYLMPQYQDVPPRRFISRLSHLKELSSLSYEQIDYVLWTYGKLQERSLSLIVTGDEYSVLIKEKWLKKNNTLSFQEIREILQKINSKREAKFK